MAGPAPVVAVVGNPNTGKSTLFNRLTGGRQHVGNFAGVTVEKKEGELRLSDGRTARLVDLPGAYSLAASSPDEQVVIDVLGGRGGDVPRPDAVLCVVDTSNLPRNLYLVTQVAETGVPIAIALNMSDEAKRKGISIDPEALSKRLGVPVVPTVATRGTGVDELPRAIETALRDRPRFAGVPWPDSMESVCRTVADAARSATGRDLTEAEVHRLMFDVESGLPRRLGWDGAETALSEARERLLAAGHDPVSYEATERYRHIESLLQDQAARPEPARAARGYAVDRVLTHRFWGLLVFAGVMFAVFASIYWLAQPLMGLIEELFAAIGGWAGAALAGAPILQSLVANGIVAGVGGVIVFLPQIAILFFFIALLEDSGYMARAAFLMDKVFSWCGLNGKSFVPMLSSFACAVPAILGTRSIEDPKARLSTILISPLMSCSARLPVYVLLIGAFIEPAYGPWWAGVALFAMHLLGLAVAIPVAFLINRFLLKIRPIPFLLEMPPYRRPRATDVALKMFRNSKEFVVRAGTVILAFAIVIWALTFFPRSESVREAVERDAAAGLSEGELESALEAAWMEDSYLGRFGKLVQPAFEPAGFDWKLTVGVLASFPAREVIVSTLGIIYNAGDPEEDDAALRERLAAATWPDGRPIYTPWVALAVMVFFALCLQCGSTVAVIARESGWRWAAFAFAYMTGLAWVGAVVAYQAGSALFGS
jgi:ferrous iron transport protein B